MLRIYELRLATPTTLTSAAARILDSEAVASCAVEPDLRRVRFIARRKLADALVRGIYAEGGLVWCSRHDWHPLHREGTEAPWCKAAKPPRSEP